MSVADKPRQRIEAHIVLLCVSFSNIASRSIVKIVSIWRKIFERRKISIKKYFLNLKQIFRWKLSESFCEKCVHRGRSKKKKTNNEINMIRWSMFIDDDSFCRSSLFDLCSFRFERSMKMMAIISIIIYATAIFCRFSYGHPNYNKVKTKLSQFVLFALFFFWCIASCDPIDHTKSILFFFGETEEKKSIDTPATWFGVIIIRLFVRSF